MKRLVQLLSLTMLISASAQAGTFIVPDDEVLIDRANLIITGTVIDSYSHYDEEGRILTTSRLAVEEYLKGKGEFLLDLIEQGGIVGNRWEANSAMPVYEPGEQYLVFVDTSRDRLSTLERSLGQFRFVPTESAMTLARASSIEGWHSDGREYRSEPRLADSFIGQIRNHLAAGDRSGSARSVAEPPRTEVNDLDTEGAAQIGVSEWSAGSIVNYSVSGSPASGNTRGDDGQDRIIVDDPNSDIGGTFNGGGTLAIAFFGGFVLSDRLDISYADIVVQDGISSSNLSQSSYNTMMTHELGHTLGFRHSDQDKFNSGGCDPGAPCTSDAIMNSFANGAFNGGLQSYDSAALSSNYSSNSAFDPDYLTHSNSGGGPLAWRRGSPSSAWRIAAAAAPGCSGPTITSQPQNRTISQGASTTLSVSATASEGSLSYQWYVGNSGNTSSPVAPGGTSSSVTVSPTSTTNYWVRVTDGCSGTNSVNSNTATVTVQGCSVPTILSQPVDRLISQGSSTTLSISVSNATSVAWYEGDSPDTSNQIGTGTSVTVSPSTDTIYFARVTNDCGFVDSRDVRVLVEVCQPVSFRSQPSDPVVESGSRATLSLSLRGSTPVSYQWFEGSSGDTSTLVSTSSVYQTPPLTSTAQYWARVSNACGSADSRTITVTVVAACEAPAITVQPQGATVQDGQTAILSVTATGTALSYQWFSVGSSGATAIPGANGSSYQTPPLSSDASYRVRVSNSCGEVDSQTVTVVVAACDLPVITSQPTDVTVRIFGSFSMTIAATGSGLSYQWYRGNTGDTSDPVSGADGPGIFIGSIQETTNFWVRVTNSCGFVDSDTATVSVQIRRRGARRG